MLKEEKRNIEKSDEILSTIDEISAYLGFGSTKTKQLLSNGHIPALHIGASYVTTKKALLSWIETNLGKEIFADEYE